MSEYIVQDTRDTLRSSSETQRVIEGGELLDQTTESFGSVTSYELTPRRWVILFTYLLVTLSGSCISICLTPVSQSIKEAYDVPLLAVSFCTLVFGLTSIPMFFISMKLLTAYPTANVLRLGCFFLVFGGWIRMITLFDSSPFWPILTGATIISFSGPIFLSAQNILCNRWFGDEERAVATAITGLAIPIGSIFAFV